MYMSFKKFRTDAFCVAGRHQSATVYWSWQNWNRPKILIGKQIQCNRTKSWFVSDNTIAAKRLGKFFKILGTSAAEIGKKTATNILIKPGQSLEIGADFGTTAVNKVPKAAVSTTPDVTFFYHTGRRLYLGKTVFFLNYINLEYKILLLCSIRTNYSYRRENGKENNECN